MYFVNVRILDKPGAGAASGILAKMTRIQMLRKPAPPHSGTVALTCVFWVVWDKLLTLSWSSSGVDVLCCGWMQLCSPSDCKDSAKPVNYFVEKLALQEHFR